MIDVDPIRGCGGEFVPVQCRVGARDDRPCVRVGDCLACEVTVFEFFEGGDEVVGVESNASGDLVVRVDLDNDEQLCLECLGTLVF